ncbi:glutamate N-acetyltransferase [Synechococcus sp. PCC 7502]|uniref:bifunctional glutamate N-acetyltransferase/amino-acid acetyltransferase ArgJ n=1 Tax=Synechococcus sp. PCC 7502 TaxID=1173263 RepID=UPI00029FB16E|nr:bifunctional glutamate N-acetyltransferase/amino-acid acetyltransferase ArgJ [Synechococcus sp. PCC 7502]AFY74164.1 glutamate N-acetyltransferase [Synechococcus sp. PCC 7502]
MADWQEVSGGVTAAKGYRASGIKAGLKPSGAPDLALIVSDVGAIAAGVFTTSCVRAACVDFNRQVLESGSLVKAILCNAGQANASTGEEGWRNAVETAQLVQTALETEESVLVASTGVIGRQLRMDLIRPAIPQVVAALSVDGGDAAAKAIITTDLVTKAIALEADFDGIPIRVGGISKGSGMIHPNMATMLAFVTCDAAVAPTLWQEMVSRACDRSFNQITVDGDTSTNDMLLALSNGQSGTPGILEAESPTAQKLEAMLTEVCIYLAKAIARDGEGATCLIEITVSGASDQAAARQVAKTIAGSSLVKSAVFGRDPNWGRIAAAAGRSGIVFDQTQLDIQLGDFVMMSQGTPQTFDRNAASNYLKSPTVQIKVKIGNGAGEGTAWGCDLSYDYVKINAEYTT